MNTLRQKSELLSNIEMLWKDAEHSADDQARTTFQRISDLMQDAMATEIVANDAAPFAVHHNNDTQNNDAQGAPHQDQNHQDETIDTLAAMVQDAATNAPEMANTPPSFEEVRTSMDSVSQIKPPREDSFNAGTPEYAFGAAFSDLVRHVVRDYIHNEVEGVIKHAIKSELDAHFKGSRDGTQGKDTHRDDAERDDESDKT